MPGTNDFPALNHPLAEWSATMQAHIVHRRIRSIHVGDADFLVTTAKFLSLVRTGKLIVRSKFDRCRHTGFVVNW